MDSNCFSLPRGVNWLFFTDLVVITSNSRQMVGGLLSMSGVWGKRTNTAPKNQNPDFAAAAKGNCSF